MVVIAPLFLGGSLALSLTMFYGVFLNENPRILEMRRIFAWHQMRWPWPLRGALPGMLPCSLGALIALVGRGLSGRTATLDGFPMDPGSDLLMLGIGVAFVGCGFMFWAPRRVLPAWYRDVLDRHAQGLEPDIPPPRSGPVPMMTLRQRQLVIALFVAVVAGTVLFSWPTSWATGAILGLAVTLTYAIRDR